MTPQERQDAGRLLGRATDELRDRARTMGSVSADELAAPAPRINLPTPAQPDMPDMGVINNVRQDVDGFIQAQDLSTESVGVRSDIARAAGQTVGQGSREISAETARNNVRSYGLASRAAVLQGNIETGAQLASQAVQFAYQDRTLRNTNLINQINSLQGVVDGQTAQLLEKDRRRYEEDQRSIVRAQSAVDAAVSSGYASPEDLKKIENLTGDPQMQGDYARSIIARGAIQERILDNQARSASINASNLSARKSLVELAMAGDPNAVAQLGFDPAAEIRELAEQEDAEVRAQKEMAANKEIERLGDTMDNITELLGNNVGLETSSGLFRNASVSGLVGGQAGNLTEADTAAGGALSGLLGTGTAGPGGAANAMQEKNDWLAKVNTILTEEGFESLININERVRLTPITNAEISLAFRAASDLNNAAIKKGDPEKGTQRIVGFRMSEEDVRKNLADMYLTAQKVQEEVKGIQDFGYEGYLRLMELEQQAQQ